MSKYLSSSYSPIIFADSITDIIQAVEHLTDVSRDIPIPITGSGFVYNRILYSKLLSIIASIGGNTINARPAVLADTEIIRALVGEIPEKHSLQWGLVYSKEQRKTNGKEGKEVSLSAIKKHVSDVITETVSLEIDQVSNYLKFVETESTFLDLVQNYLAPETTKTSEKVSSSIVSKPVNESELERFKGIAEKMKLLQRSKSDEVNPDDLW